MKNQSFLRRLNFASSGVHVAFHTEASFRVQSYFAIAALVLLLLLQAPPIWWALMTLTTGGVLATELLNTALEAMADRLHPEMHEMIGKAKNCAAGAVLVLSVCSLIIGSALIVDRWPWLVAQFIK